MRERLAVLILVLFAAAAYSEQLQQAPQVARVQAERVIVEVPDQARDRFDQLGFVAVPRYRYDQRLAPLYREFSGRDQPVVVTTDAALHTSHLLYDWCLRFLEIAYLREDLIALSDAFITESMNQYALAKDDAVKDAAVANAAGFIVGKRLLVGGDSESIPQPWGARIDEEVKAVTEASGMSGSPLFGYKEDYTQYKPRGHYARTETFKGYFRAMMWFGRMTLRFNTRDQAANTANARRAMLIANAWSSAKVRGEAARDVWERIYQTTGFFAGKSDDLTPDRCHGAMTISSYHDAFDPSDPKSVSNFLDNVQKMPRPRILGAPASSSRTTGAQPWQDETFGMTIFGQRWSPDAWVMQQLTFDSIGSYTGSPGDGLPFTCVRAGNILIRGFPRGLDVMAVLGLERAGELLSAGGDDRYERYAGTLARLKDTIGKAVTSGMPEDLYIWRLRAAATLAQKPAGTLPRAMNRPEWADKELTAALASWSEHRRDVILYTKESYTARQSAMAGLGKAGPTPPPPPPPQGYVEPMPQTYAAIRGGVDALREKLKNLSYPDDRMLSGCLERFAQNLDMLEAISRKELAGEKLSDAEFSFIEHIGSAFAAPISGFPHSKDVDKEFMSKDEDLMPVIADVHTDVNSGQVLEEAVGIPMVLYMLCPVNGRDTVCVGVVYSHHEFKQPMANRLTDEEWRQMLGDAKAPEPGPWMNSYLVKGPSQ